MKNFIYSVGISLLELLLSLAIIGVILIMATRYYGIARTAQQSNEAAGMVVAVYSAGHAWLQSENDLSGVTEIKALADKGLIPANFTLENANPWSGPIDAKSFGNDNLQLQVTLENVPIPDCQNLLAKILNKLPVDKTQTKCDSVSVIDSGTTTFRAILNFTPQ